jgi:hypothetical protein
MSKRINRRRSALVAAGFLSLGIVLSGPVAHAAPAGPGGPGDYNSTPTTQPCSPRQPNCDKAPPPRPDDECEGPRCDISDRPDPQCPRNQVGDCHRDPDDGGDNPGGGGGDRPNGGGGTKVGGNDIVHANPTFTG